VEHVEAIAVADRGDGAEEAAAAEEARGDVAGRGEAAQVGLVEGHETKGDSGRGGGGDPVVRNGEVVADVVF
jgi:hypothetical protein